MQADFPHKAKPIKPKNNFKILTNETLLSCLHVQSFISNFFKLCKQRSNERTKHQKLFPVTVFFHIPFLFLVCDATMYLNVWIKKLWFCNFIHLLLFLIWWNVLKYNVCLSSFRDFSNLYQHTILFTSALCIFIQKWHFGDFFFKGV